jgi:hypothetical protein
MKKSEAPALPAGRSARLRLFLLSLLTAVSVLAVMVVLPVAFVATAFWAADGSWDFEGRGVRYWMFVQGTRLERLGIVEPTASPVKFSISLQEGNFPGWNIAAYESAAQPDKIISVYAERCSQMKLKIIENKSGRNPGTGALRAEMTCEIEVYLNVEILAEREPSAAVSKVFVKVWGSE